MVKKTVVRNVCLINRYYPPNPGIAGEAASELVDNLLRLSPDLSITVIRVEAPYLFAGVSAKKPAGNVIFIRTCFAGNQNLGLRFIRNLVEGYRLMHKALKKADIIISMTDPPLLNYWAGTLCSKKNIPWIYWAVDLYPQAYRAAKLADENNILYRHLNRSFRKHVPSFLIALGEGQSKYLQEHWDKQVPSVVLPCGIQKNIPESGRPLWRENDDKIYFTYAGNISEPHDPDFLIDFVDCLDEKKHKFILAIYGSRSQYVLNHVKKHPAVEIVKNVKRDELSYIDVHLVSLLPAWTHISVPSKAVSAVCAGQTVLFSGLEDSDTWKMFNEAGWFVPHLQDAEERRSAIKAMLLELADSSLLTTKKKNAAMLRQKLLHMESEAYYRVLDWLGNENLA